MNRNDPGPIPFALPEIGDEEIAEVIDTLKSGWITTGPKTQRFEEDFQRRMGAAVTCVAVNSATAGLHLALEALGVGPGDEVIVPTHTFTATAEVVRYLGADVRLVDIEPVSYCIDPAAAADAVRPNTKVIMPVHYAGLAADMDRISALGHRHDLRIVEDAAHAFPTRYKNRLIGTLDTDATVFSFYATKTLATGEGGMLVTSRENVARRARIMRLHGIDRDAFERYRSTKPSWYYEVVAPGFKYNMTDMAAALGIHQLKKADAFRSRRQEMAARYSSAFASLPLILPPEGAAGCDNAWHLYVVQIRDDARIHRDDAIAKLFSQGIGCSVHYVPLHLQPYWRERYALQAEAFPNSQRLYERGFSLPIYTKMSDEDQERVIEVVTSLF